MATIGDGLAVHEDPVRAAEVAARQALDPLGDRRADLVCLFACTDDRDGFTAAIDRVRDLSAPRALLGCTAEGVLGGGQGVERLPAVSVWAARLPGVSIRTFQLDMLRTAEGAGVIGLPEITANDHVGVLIADPFTFPAGSFVEMTNDVLPGFPLVGGLASRPGEGSSWLAVDEAVRDSGAVGAVIRGGTGWRTVVSQGCRPIGPAMAVTRAEGNILYELAGMPAVSKLEEVLSALSPDERELATTGLQIGMAMDEYAERHEQGDFLIRGLIGADRESGAILVGDVMEVGRTVRFQLRDARSAQVDLADTLAGVRGPGALTSVDGALLFSCNGRGAATFPSADHDVLAVRTALGTRGVAGFFAAGEIGPVGGRNHLHGFTASILAFGHRDDQLHDPA
jgi:small ligand-binding sensory domain FIST